MRGTVVGALAAGFLLALLDALLYRSPDLWLAKLSELGYLE